MQIDDCVLAASSGQSGESVSQSGDFAQTGDFFGAIGRLFSSMGRHRISAAVKSATRPSILGIWRLGKPLHVSDLAELALAQPADAVGSPRWDYVIKRALNGESDVESRHQIGNFASAATAAVHPNLVAVLDASASSATPYVVMPRLDGSTMQWHLDQSVNKPLPLALWFIRQVSQALASLHDAGWVHGDVKPANVVIGPRGHVTLVDLGFATRVQTVSRGTFRGTPDFSAPETLVDNIAAMPPQDVYSLGNVLKCWLGRIEPVHASLLKPVNDLVSSMTASAPTDRPTADEVTRVLLTLEIETLGRHIGPGDSGRIAA